MARFRLKSAFAGCLVALALGGAISGCGEEEPGLEEPAREGLTIDVGGVEYTVFITRELNLEIPPDQAYYDGPPAEAGSAFFGVFLTACNPKDADEAMPATDDFSVEDNQGNEFEPVEVPEENPFVYVARDLAPGTCIPEDGSIAAQGPTAGAMLLFEFPLESTENRPLELTITPTDRTAEPKHVELDL